MARVMPTLVVFLFALVLMRKAATAIDCMSLGSSILPCSDFLRDPKLTAPGSSCCLAASHLLGLGDVSSLCECLNPFTSGFLPSKAQLLHDLCNLSGFSPLVTCLAPSIAKPDTILPPLGSLPPIFPLPPVFPLPPIFPLPPFIHLPPFFPPAPPTA